MSAARTSSPRIRAVAEATPAALAPRPRRPAKSFEELSVVEQVQLAFRPRNRLATGVGLVLGAFVPIASFTIAHSAKLELVSLPALLVLGGLAFSAPTVFGWARLALGSSVKALGFVVLVEGVLVASPIRWLAVAALVVLAAINAFATGARLSRRVAT